MTGGRAPNGGMWPRPWTLERIRRRCVVDPVTGCHLWQGAQQPTGYARVGTRGRTVYVHRLAWCLANGVVLAELSRRDHVAHLCHVRSCVNPEHLVLSTPWENSADTITAGRAWWQTRTTCRNGHDLATVGTRERVTVTGYRYRYCAECSRLAGRRARARNRARRTELGPVDTGNPDAATPPGPSAS